MAIEMIEYKGHMYPSLQAKGNAARWVREFALELCKGTGYDIGYGDEDWKLPGAIGIDKKHGEYEAMLLPDGEVDYIHSSHCIEHLPNWVDALEYWHSKLKAGGVLFLYLPDMDKQVYWRGWHNKKHIHYLTPQIMDKYFNDSGLWKSAIVTGADLNCSFIAVAEKR